MKNESNYKNTTPFYSSGRTQFFLGRSEDVMKYYPDKYFDLAIVDPPYGIGQNWSKDKRAKFYTHRNNFNDDTPGPDYFEQLFRVSKHQIIWGCNYYWNFLPPSNNLIFWDKGKNTKTQHGSAGELAWVSFTKYPLMKYEFAWNGCVMCEKTQRIHPHQKPVKLYEQCLIDFASPGMRILDTHLGSGSSAVASEKQGFEFTGIEKEEIYLRDAINRYKNEMAQLRMPLIPLPAAD
ncbi:MAG: DNA methyltransferase [Marinilabiliaceae bacterium]